MRHHCAQLGSVPVGPPRSHKKFLLELSIQRMDIYPVRLLGTSLPLIGGCPCRTHCTLKHKQRESEPGLAEALGQKVEGPILWQDAVSSSESEPAQHCVL